MLISQALNTNIHVFFITNRYDFLSLAAKVPTGTASNSRREMTAMKYKQHHVQTKRVGIKAHWCNPSSRNTKTILMHLDV